MQPTTRVFFWSNFSFVALQALLALITNFTKFQALLYSIPVVSLIFAAVQVKLIHALEASASTRAVFAFLMLVFYLLATGFFVITAVFVGGLG